MAVAAVVVVVDSLVVATVVAVAAVVGDVVILPTKCLVEAKSLNPGSGRYHHHIGLSFSLALELWDLDCTIISGQYQRNIKEKKQKQKQKREPKSELKRRGGFARLLARKLDILMMYRHDLPTMFSTTY